MAILLQDEIEEAFEHLDHARTYMNPMMAGSDFKQMFDWSRSQRAKVVGAWMETFDGKSSIADRIKASNLQEEMV